MNLLREYIRELLTEVAKTPRDLPKNVVVDIQAPAQSGGLTQIRYTDEDGKNLGASYDGPWGEVYIVNIKGREYGPCGGAWKVSSSQAGNSWGPMLYDVAMEYATEMGGGLIADRDAVSPSARRVWDYYLGNRGDVASHQLDNLDNELTPEIEEDNCDQRVAGFDVNRPAGGRYSPRKKVDVDWVESPLSKRYTKEPATMNALRAAGKLVEL
jgi:hypothetical protein